MATIMRFPVERSTERKNTTGETAAEIIIFPGVRIERPAAAKASKRSLSRKQRLTKIAINQDID